MNGPSLPLASGKNTVTPNRRRAIAACVATCAALLLPCGAHAQAYPDRAISYIVPSSPGSSPDIVGRIMADALAKILGQPVVVLNRPGAGGPTRRGGSAQAGPAGPTHLQGPPNHSLTP